jgi:hypothetical protein
MSFDKPTRTLLAKMVAACRKRLADDVASQLQSTYGLYPDGTVLDVARTADERYAAADLLALWQHLEKAEAGNAKTQQQNAYRRLVREIGFTLLNRLAALRLAEERGLLIECVRRGLESDGFQVFDQMANGSLGSRYATYRAFLDGIYAELALDLGALFDRSDPRGLLFPSEAALADLLAEFNHPDLAARALWQQDETIGWIYQYYNDPAERKQMRDASQAPRNSRELAVRNQFFTPRYVVEFLTDNTLGRIWYEMTAGRTQLAAQCRYLVRRPGEVFVGETGYLGYDWGYNAVELACQQQWQWLPDALSWNLLSGLSLALDGDDPTIVGRAVPGDARPPAEIVAELAAACAAEHAATGAWRGSSLVLWLCLFEAARRHRAAGSEPGERELDALNELLRAWRAVLQAEADATDQQALLRQPVYVARRRPKDPRTITMLDPGCGSMHFGLYAFDLYEIIYSEAWEIEARDGPDVLVRPAPLQSLHATYPDRAAFLRDVPRLIIENNIHGIDIDPRAVQIANLSLWLRAQRSWQAQGVPAAARPRIRRSNVVTAEPMPGDRGLLEEFVATLHPPVLGELVRGVFDKMQLAGEAGSLLKIETELATAIAQAQAQWEAGQEVQAALLPELAPPRQGELFDVSNIDDAAFWKQAEARVLDALARYAGQHDLRHRLFAGDAARGFAFIDVCRKRYDVVLMNPPFGAGTGLSTKLIEATYPECRNDVYGAFVSRANSLLKTNGSFGAITNRTGFFTAGYETWRSKVLFSGISSLRLFVDLGSGVLDSALVETAAYCCDRSLRHSAEAMSLIGAEEKSIALLEEILSLQSRSIRNRSFRTVIFDNLAGISARPFAYWAPLEILHLYNLPENLEPAVLEARQGLRTLDDFRFLRLWWEVSLMPERDETWIFHLKGGPFQKYFANPHLVCNWKDSGSEIKALVEARYGSVSRIIQAQDYYFRSGLTYTRRTSSRFSVRAAPGGCNFADRGPLIVPTRDIPIDKYFLLGLLNSPLIAYMISLSLAAAEGAARSYEVGILQRLPWLGFAESAQIEIAEQAHLIVEAIQASDRQDPTSSGFVPSTVNHVSIRDCFGDLEIAHESTLSRIRTAVTNIDNIVCEQANISFNSPWLTDYRDFNGTNRMDVVANDDDDAAGATSGYTHQPPLLDWLRSIIDEIQGAIFGRWDIRYATGARPAPPLPDPFAPLPACPPGMLQNSQGLPAAPADVPADYPLSIAWDGILVDDPGLGEDAEPHPADIVRRVREALAVVYGEEGRGQYAVGSGEAGQALPTADRLLPTPESIEAEACAILGVRELRDYFRKPGGFFADHLKRYSKSRRQAPIYWPLSTASGRYTVWLYYHRLNGETLYTVVNRYVEPKIAAVERALAAAEAGMGQATGSAAVKLSEQADDLRAFRAELDAFRGELLRVAGLPYQPNLNDGVLLNAAPLHRLFGLRRWAKDTEAAWRKLEAGDYDWAHMAYTIWPARVKEVCRRDRSIAIAHGLEALCEVPIKTGKRPSTAATTAATADLDFEGDDAES